MHRGTASSLGEQQRTIFVGLATLLLLYLCGRMLLPFAAALCWAFALALITHPVYAWVARKTHAPNLSAVLMVTAVLAIVVAPTVLAARPLVRETTDIVQRVAAALESGALLQGLENNRVLGSLFRWLDAQVGLPQDTAQIARAAARWVSSGASSIVTGSVWLITQIGSTLFVLFFFLRDGETIACKMRALLPIPEQQTEVLAARVAQVIRVALGGKLVVACLQGALGGLIFYWLGVPGPLFWGSVMALLSVFPVVGSFLVWGPVALSFALEGNWGRAIILTVWGLLVIHPVDNVLTPVLVGNALRVHTLLLFLAIVGGLAAFGAAGIIAGPVVLAVVTGLAEMLERTRAQAESEARPARQWV